MINAIENRGQKTEVLPLVPLRDVVVFPYTMIPFVVGRKSSLVAVEKALLGDKRIFLATQRDAKIDDPKPEEINYIGTIANIVQSLKLPNGNIKLLVEGATRGKVLEIREDDGFLVATLEPIEGKVELTPEIETEMGKVVSLCEKYVKLSPNLPYETMISTIRVSEPGRLTDTIAAHVQVGMEDKQNLLETFGPAERLTILANLLDAEIEKLRVDRRIHQRVKKQMEKAQKEYYLNEKMKAIQQELGRKDDKLNEIEELKEKIAACKMPKEAHEKAMQELKRLEVMPPVSAEATVSRNYLDWLISVPWHKRTKEIRDLDHAEKVLNEDHYGLEKIKERIVEFLAVRRLVKNKSMKGTILCFVGPPGVGKRSEERRVGKECRSQWWADQAEDGIRDRTVTGVQTCALPILAQAHQGDPRSRPRREGAQRGPLRAGEDQGAHRRVPRGPEAGQEQEHEGDDPLLRGPAGRRQEIGRASCRERV